MDLFDGRIISGSGILAGTFSIAPLQDVIYLRPLARILALAAHPIFADITCEIITGIFSEAAFFLARFCARFCACLVNKTINTFDSFFTALDRCEAELVLCLELGRDGGAGGIERRDATLVLGFHNMKVQAELVLCLELGPFTPDKVVGANRRSLAAIQ